jgi:hypothetical protein
MASDNLYWDGGSVLFSTNPSGQLDDVKIADIADVTPLDPSYTGLTFWDRSVDGVVGYYHNAGGRGGNGSIDGSTWVTTGNQGACGSGGMYGAPSEVAGSQGLYLANSGVGRGCIVGTPRGDGITDGFTTIQGVRTYDAAINAWTTPDAYQGEVHDPLSQKAYVWNNNNPITYEDPSGYDTIYLGERQAEGKYDHVFLAITDDNGRLKEVIDFGPSSHALHNLAAFGSTVTLGEPRAADTQAFNNSGTTGSSTTSAYVVGAWSCIGVCTFKNGGFDEAAANAKAVEIGKAQDTYGSYTSNSASALSAVCSAGAGAGACNAAKNLLANQNLPGWNGSLWPPLPRKVSW